MATGAQWAATGRRSRPREDPAAGGAGHILVVDDEPGGRRVLRRCLELSRYTVEECGSAEDALREVERSVYDLVFLDLNLPDGSGHDVLAEIRANPASRLLPVVMLTGMATTEEKIRALKA